MRIQRFSLISLLLFFSLGMIHASTFSVTATDGPFPTTIASGMTFSATASITLLVAPDPALHSVTGYDAIASIGYGYGFVGATCSLTAVEVYDACPGWSQYEVQGGNDLFDTGIQEYFSNGPGDAEPFGVLPSLYEGPGVIVPDTVALSAGPVTFRVFVYDGFDESPFGIAPSGGVVTLSRAYDFTTLDITVTTGDVTMMPEPSGLSALLCAVLLWLFHQAIGAIGLRLRGRRDLK